MDLSAKLRESYHDGWQGNLVKNLSGGTRHDLPRLTRNQVRSFWAAWGGWTMDGMDSFIYSLVLVPALRDFCRSLESRRPRRTLGTMEDFSLPCS
jgi:hypothetical protein